MDWIQELEDSRKDGGLLISKVSPPSGVPCDHKDSVWEHYNKEIKRAIQTCDFVILYQTDNLVSIAPRKKAT